MLLLLRRRKEAVELGIARGFPIPRIAERIQNRVSSGIVESRIISRSAGAGVLDAELAAVGTAGHGLAGSSLIHIGRDTRRANVFARNYADQWIRKAQGDTLSQAARTADAESVGSLKRIAVTESAEAFNDGKTKAAEELAHSRHSLLKVWDAELDKRTCPICFAADGTIVGIKENFPQGEPGAVHPWCRCTWHVLTFEENGDTGLIEPKEPTKVVSLPPAAPASPSAAAQPSVKGSERLLTKPPTESQALAGKFGKLAEALESGSQADQRAALRGIVKDAIPSATSKDVTLKGAFKTKAHVLKATGGMADATGADAVHEWNGAISIDASVLNRARAGNPDALRVLVHEEIHGHSRVTLASYKGAGKVLEEVGTEMHARAAVSRVYQEAEFSGAYQEWIDTVVNIVQGAADDAEREVSVARVLKAHSKVVGPGPRFASEHEALDTFVSGLDLPESAHQYTKDALTRTFGHLE